MKKTETQKRPNNSINNNRIKLRKNMQINNIINQFIRRTFKQTGVY